MIVSASRVTYLRRDVLFLLRVKGEQIRNVLLETLSFPMQSRDFLSHRENLPREFLLELFDVD